MEGYLQEYMKATYQSFRVRTNNTVAARNKIIRSSGSKTPLLLGEWENYDKTFVCTHADKYWSRGQGKRKRIQSRALDCDAQINACVQVSDGEFVLRITLARLVHNHSLHEQTFRHYPYNRTALEPEVLGTVNELRKAGARKKRILKCIQENSVCHPTNQDVQNLVRRLRKRDNTALTGAKRLKLWMLEFSRGADTGFRVQNFQSGLGIQTDSYNCGVYVLLAFEMFCRGEPLGHLDKKTLQCLRYRYLCMCV